LNLTAIPNKTPVHQPDAKQNALRPPLKWAGGKRWQLPYLKQLWSAHGHRRFVEPFCGGLGITLGLRPTKSLLNDSNPHLINFYRWLKRGLSSSMVKMANDEKSYYARRNRFNHLIQQGLDRTAEAAALFYYLNRTGYNGLCRFNRTGEFNVPFGRHRTINYLEDFGLYRRELRRWELQSVDFGRLRLLPGDFVYADPPYDVEFTQYAPAGFTWDDQLRCARWLTRHRGPVVLSNQATPRIVRLYRSLGFDLHFLKAPRLISCSGDRTPADEVLALKNL
jgi:DNA adenine methylase